MTIQELVAGVPEFVNELVEAVERGAGLREVEERVVVLVNRLGSLVVQEVVDRVGEPVEQNRIWVGGQEAVFDGYRNLRFRNRFGQISSKRRRCYRYLQKSGGYYPLDERLGLDKCGGYSPLMSYLQTLFGCSRPYGESGRLLSAAVGFGISSTAVQWNTEHSGELLRDEPHRTIRPDRRGITWQRMIVEMDSTTSPQIHQEQQISGREGLKQPTEWKQCHVGIVQRLRRGRLVDEWTVARYGTLEAFGLHLGRTALQLGLERTSQVVFLSDGLLANWQICLDHFPDALQILDFYHASEHLGQFCSLWPDQAKANTRYQRWRRMLLEGEILQVIAEMKRAIPETTEPDEAVKHWAYFKSNADRMHYEQYRAAGLPIGSGKVEGGCKFVVGKRFKGSGMRWMRRDNEQVLRARLAYLNGYLHGHFEPTPQRVALSKDAAVAA